MKLITSLANAAKYLGCSQKTIQRMLKRGEMPEPAFVEEHAKGAKRIWTTTQLDTIVALVAHNAKHGRRHLCGSLPENSGNEG